MIGIAIHQRTGSSTPEGWAATIIGLILVYGTAANVLLLAAVIYGAAAHGPTSFGAQYEQRISAALAQTVDPAELHAAQEETRAIITAGGPWTSICSCVV